MDQWKKVAIHLTLERVELIHVKPTCVNPLTVASRDLDTGSRKLRLCWDGSRRINPMLKKMSVNLSHFPKAAEILYEGDYQVSLDLKSFILHIKHFLASQQICLMVLDASTNTPSSPSVSPQPRRS